MYNIVLLLTILFGVPINVVETSRILAVFPIYGKSHYTAFENLAKELVNRGHELVVINNFPQKNKINGFTDINVSNYTESCVNFAVISDLSHIPTGTLYDMKDLFDSIFEVSRVFEAPEVKRLISSDDERFDLLIAEMFHTDIALGFAYKYKIPVIGFQFSKLMPWINERFANPENPSYVPCISSQYHNKMNFLQRLGNSLETWISILVYKYFFIPRSEFYARKYFGDDLPPLEELAKNSTMILFNSHHSIHGARSLVPAVVEVGGLHIGPPKDLPKDLEKFINESEHGVIYFCMGSMLRASTLPEEKRRDIIEVFSKLPQRVLWKWETENMPDKPDNVKLAKWMPQRDILAHPNIKLFISHGGLLGVTEAVYSGIPIIGMPFYGDQGVNIEAVKAAGAGLRLDFNDLNKNSLEKAIKEILENPEYKENALQLSIRFKDRPQTPLETAVYWTEYVIRHKGAPHLRSAAVDLAWYQYLLLDVIAFLLVSFIVISLIIFYTFRFIFSYIKQILFRPHKTKVSSNRKNK